MLFQRASRAVVSEEEENRRNQVPESTDDIDTVVGPSVSVEGDFSSEGNIIVKGVVTGSVHTSKHLLVEPGAKIIANIRAGTAQIGGEVKGNVKIKGSLEIGAFAKILGDIETQTLAVEPGAIIYGRVVMPGMDIGESRGRGRRKAPVQEIITEEDDEMIE